MNIQKEKECSLKIQGHEILFKTIIGSQAYGTNIEGVSDLDYKGVFIQSPEDKYINGYKDELKINKDEVYFELEKFLTFCANGNPTMLELLYSTEHCIVHTTDIFKDILAMKDIFLTKNLRHSFANYAYDQIRKSDGLDKMMNWEKDKTTRKSVEDMCSVYKFPNLEELYSMFETNGIKLSVFLENESIQSENCGLVKIDHFRDCYLLFHSTEHTYNGISSGIDANDICLSAIPRNEIPIGILFFHKDAYSSHCKDYKNYQEWLEKRNTQRYVDVEGHGQKIDGKNILHCVRIVETSMEIPVQKTINIFRPNRKFLIDIRRGKYDLATLQTKAEADILAMHELFKNSDLPDKFEFHEEIKSFINNTRKKYYENTVRN